MLSADIAVYPKGAARPTGGAGAIAVLIGPNAPLKIDDVRSTFMDHQYGFYKPNPFNEYPLVDGHLSINVYMNALKHCFEGFKEKSQKMSNEKVSFSTFDYFCFHTPFYR